MTRLPIESDGVVALNAAGDIGKRESRRLFYVGLTRAKAEVHMTYSGWTQNRYGRRFDRGPSEFLADVRDRLQEAEF